MTEKPSQSAPAAVADRTPTRPVAVVTGASDGIGRAIAGRLAARGQSLLLIARSPGPLAAAAAAIRGDHPAEIATLTLDLAAPDAPAVLDAELARLGAHVDLLVNNAAVGYCGDFDAAAPHELDHLVALNVAAPGRLMLHVLPGMRRRRRGGVLNVASLGGYTPGPYQAAYYASKAYLMSLSEAVSAEVRADGVRVTVVAPGPVATGFHARMQAEGALYRFLLPASSPESVARWALLGYDLGLSVVVPGLFNVLSVVPLRVLPHALLVPLMALLLNPRRSNEQRSR
jgi:short-subunit dehydrogenase